MLGEKEAGSVITWRCVDGNCMGFALAVRVLSHSLDLWMYNGLD